MTALNSLPDRKPLFGLCISYSSPGIIERIGPDWDWIWIDGQHSEPHRGDLPNLVRACDLIRRPVVVRTSGHDYGSIGHILDSGAAGVIVPCVDTEEQAHALVQAAKFPPLGGRSYGSRRIVDLRGRNYSDTANENTLLIAQIESPLAITNVEAIAAVPGVDALFLGPDDIMLRRGLPMSMPRTPETLGDDMRAVIAAARRHGKRAVAVAVTPEMIRFAIELGYDLVTAGSDVGFLSKGSAEARARVSELATP